MSCIQASMVPPRRRKCRIRTICSSLYAASGVGLFDRYHWPSSMITPPRIQLCAVVLEDCRATPMPPRGMFIKSLACNGLGRFGATSLSSRFTPRRETLADRPDISGGSLVSVVQRRRMRQRDLGTLDKLMRRKLRSLYMREQKALAE